MSNHKFTGYWRGNRSIALIEIGGRTYALNEWNGREYLYCWECFPDADGTYTAGNEDYAVRPIYRYMIEGRTLSDFYPGSREWDEAHEVIGYEVERM